jgi:hypothetical protein
MNENTVSFGYSSTEFAVFTISTLTAVEVVIPLPTTASTTTGMATTAFTGLTGYMTLGLGAKAKPSVLPISESEVMIMKDSMHFWFKFSKTDPRG